MKTAIVFFSLLVGSTVVGNGGEPILHYLEATRSKDFLPRLFARYS